MTPKEKFDAVENALRQIAESLKSEGLVKSIELAEHRGRPTFPRVFVWARRGVSEDHKVGRSSRLHKWRFEYIIETLSVDPQRSYEEAKNIHWRLYEKVAADPTLGINSFYVNAKPAAEFERLEGVNERGQLGHIWIQAIDVVVEV